MGGRIGREDIIMMGKYIIFSSLYFLFWCQWCAVSCIQTMRPPLIARARDAWKVCQWLPHRTDLCGRDRRRGCYGGDETYTLRNGGWDSESRRHACIRGRRRQPTHWLDSPQTRIVNKSTYQLLLNRQADLFAGIQKSRSSKAIPLIRTPHFMSYKEVRSSYV